MDLASLYLVLLHRSTTGWRYTHYTFAEAKAGEGLLAVG